MLHLAHLGCVHMKTLAKSCVLWPGIDSDTEKTGKDIFLLLGPIQQRHLRWEAQSGIHVGIEEPVQKSDFFVVVEFFQNGLMCF